MGGWWRNNIAIVVVKERRWNQLDPQHMAAKHQQWFDQSSNQTRIRRARKKNRVSEMTQCCSKLEERREKQGRNASELVRNMKKQCLWHFLLFLTTRDDTQTSTWFDQFSNQKKKQNSYKKEQSEWEITIIDWSVNQKETHKERNEGRERPHKEKRKRLKWQSEQQTNYACLDLIARGGGGIRETR